MKQIHVSTDGDFLEACKQAAFNYPAEIVVYGRNPNDGLVVYSDDDFIFSGLYWRERIAELRSQGQHI